MDYAPELPAVTIKLLDGRSVCLNGPFETLDAVIQAANNHFGPNTVNQLILGMTPITYLNFQLLQREGYSTSCVRGLFREM